MGLRMKLLGSHDINSLSLDRLTYELDAGLSPHATSCENGEDEMILIRALNLGRQDILALLLERGADPNTIDPQTNEPLLCTVIGYYVEPMEMVRSLLKSGANPNKHCPSGRCEGWTAMHFAAERGEREIMEALLAEGGEIGARLLDGRSVEDIAIEKGNTDVIPLIVAYRERSDFSNIDNGRILERPKPRI